MSDWIHEPHNTEFLSKTIPKNNRYNNKILGAIGNKESENDLVWIILQAHQFNWKKVNIPKFKGHGTDLMSILYADPNHRKFFYY